jgi:hypothetical protein
MILAAVLSAWVQYAADGKPHARAVVPQTCPAVTYAGGSAPMRRRAAAAVPFDDVVCDAPLPDGATNVAVEGTHLPSPSKSPRTIVVFGDTGCRMKGEEQQNCGDIADWPFPKIAQTIAAVHPDLLVHVGDYFYRESNCPPVMKACVNRWGDTSMSWNADWFSPGKPLFATAPIVLTRGNHENCGRGGRGWYHYLDVGDTAGSCVAGALDGSPPYALSFDGLRIVVADSAGDPSDSAADPAWIAFYDASFRKAQALAAGATGDAWFVTHRPPYANTDETTALRALNWHLAPFDVVLAGHVHDFEAINLVGYPSMIVNGESGDVLEDAGETAKYVALQQDAGKPFYTFATPSFSSKQYGFAVYTKSATGWTISLRDADGIERRSCALTKGRVSCP